MSKIVIFGTGDMARIANYYFASDSEHEVSAFTVDRKYMGAGEFEGKPVVPFENSAENYSPQDYDMFIAVSYKNMNRIREQKYTQAKELGYKLVSYVSSRCSYLSQYSCGDNCFILEDNTIQPYVRIGNNVWLWSGNHVGHDSSIEDHVYISSHIVISGFCVIGKNSFIGVNATFREGLNIGAYSLIGAGAVIMKDTAEKDVWLPARSTRLEKKSDELDF